MVNLKLVEVYAVLLMLCTALVVFGVYQMQAALKAVLDEASSSYLQMVLQGVQIAAVALIGCTLIMVLFFRHLRKKYSGKENAKRP